MGTGAQRGNTLLETTVAVGIVATIAGATLSASSMAAGAAGRTAARATLQDAVEREMRVALDVLKYQGGTLQPVSVVTSAPMPNGSPLPLRMSLRASLLSDGATAVSISAASLTDAAQSVTLEATLDHRAPLPGTQLRAPDLVPAPTGAP